MNFLKPLMGAALAFLSAASFAAIDVNKASQAELESVKGLGPAMSTKILDARKTGPFSDWDDLQSRVKGVGSGNAAKLSSEGLTVNGTNFGAAPVAETTAKPAKGKTTGAATK
jgi:competence protein ComEA